jgi:hypothetical protein
VDQRRRRSGAHASAANQHALAIHFKQTAALVGNFGGDFTDAESGGGGIRDVFAKFDAEFGGVEIGIAHLVGPPEMRMGEVELRERVGNEANNFGFVAGEFNGLREMLAVDVGMENGFDGMIGSVAQLGAERERGGLVVGIEFGGDERRAESDLAGVGQENFAPDAHVLVGRSGIPVDPGEAEVVFFRSEDFDGESVFARLVEQSIDAKFIGAISTGNVGAVGYLFAVEPDVGAIVDAEKMEPGGPVGETGGRGEFDTKPERTAIGTISRHVAVGEGLFTTEGDTGKGSQVHAVVRVGESFVCNLRTDNRAGNFGFVPILGGETGSGDGFRGGLVDTGRLQLPGAVKRDARRRRGGSSHGGGIKKK